MKDPRCVLVELFSLFFFVWGGERYFLTFRWLRVSVWLSL